MAVFSNSGAFLNKNILSSKDLETVIHAFISSRLDYCNSLYLGICHSSLSRLQLVQNAAARLLTGTRKRENITPVLASLHWLPVKYRINFKVLLFVFKALHGLAPGYISDLLSLHLPTRSLRSSSQVVLSVPRSQLKSRGDRAFSIAAPRLWNSLPPFIKFSSSLEVFKSNLKTYLFFKAFGSPWYPFYSVYLVYYFIGWCCMCIYVCLCVNAYSFCICMCIFACTLYAIYSYMSYNSFFKMFSFYFNSFIILSLCSALWPTLDVF